MKKRLKTRKQNFNNVMTFFSLFLFQSLHSFSLINLLFSHALHHFTIHIFENRQFVFISFVEILQNTTFALYDSIRFFII